MDIGILTGMNIQRNKSFSILESDFKKAALKSDSLKNHFEEILGIMEENAQSKNSSSDSWSKVTDNTGFKNTGKCNSGEEIQKEKVKPENQSEIKLKNIDKELIDMLSLIIFMNSSGKIDNYDIAIQIKGNQTRITGTDINMVLNQETVKTIADNLISNLQASFEKFVSAISSGNLSEYSGKGLKDIFRKIFYDAVMQGISLETGNPAMAESEASRETNPENIQENFTDFQLLKLQEVPKGSIKLLEHAIDKLMSELEILGRFEDMDLENLIKSSGSDKEGFTQEKKKLFGLGENFVSDISNELKNLTGDLVKIASTKNSKESDINISNGSTIKPVRNPVFFEEKLLQASDIRTGQEIIINRATEKTGAPIDNFNSYTRINPSDIISQINSSIIGENGQILKSLEIKLKPESLGMIKIKAEERGNGISIKIVTQYSYTEKIISSGMEMLKKNFSESGFRLNDLLVFSDAGMEHQSNADSQDFGNFLNQGFASDFSSKDSGMPQSDVTSVNTGEENQSSDYKISATEYGDPYHIDIMA
jgi:hypothetical protein